MRCWPRSLSGILETLLGILSKRPRGQQCPHTCTPPAQHGSSTIATLRPTLPIYQPNIAHLPAQHCPSTSPTLPIYQPNIAYLQPNIAHNWPMGCAAGPGPRPASWKRFCEFSKSGQEVSNAHIHAHHQPNIAHLPAQHCPSTSPTLPKSQPAYIFAHPWLSPPNPFLNITNNSEGTC